MISIKDVTILDILPYTFKTDEYTALSRAIAALTAYFYKTMSSVLFWADIDNASPIVLDAMAAELDASFYSTDMTDKQKRSIIAATFAYNSRVGTVSAVEKLVEAAFGGGEVAEWFDYGGEPYHFKIDVTKNNDIHADVTDIEYFFKMIDKIKNKRAKPDELDITEPDAVQSDIYIGGTAIGSSGYEKVGADFTSYNDTILSEIAVGIHYAESGYEKVGAQQYRTYEEVKAMTNEELKNKTYAEVLYKEDE